MARSTLFQTGLDRVMPDTLLLETQITMLQSSAQAR
jgi:hypothetical protein